MFAAIVVAHAKPELEHVRRQPVSVAVEVDETGARLGVDGEQFSDQIGRYFRGEGIRVRDVDTSEDVFGPAVIVSVDVMEQPAGEKGNVAFTIRVALREAVLVPPHTVARADIWSRAVLGVAAHGTLGETVRDGMRPLIEQLGEDLGAGHPDPDAAPEPAPASSKEGVSL